MAGTAHILGQRQVVDRLWRAMDRDGLHHAYLFEGPPGLGKHTVARLLAKAANCERQDLPALERPCGACASCKLIESDNHPDVVTLAPLPDRKTPVISVSQVRELVRSVALSRFSARRRFLIVDPVDAMRDEAANALLKTLEEPPPATGFVLVTAQVSSLLPTILSRCQRVRFSPVPVPDVERWLTARGVADASTLAALSLGRPGEALRLSDGGLEERIALRTAMFAALGGSLPEIYSWSQALTKLGGAPARAAAGRVLDLLEDLLRDATLAAHGRGPYLNGDIPEVVERWADALWPTGVERCARALDEAREQLTRNVNTRTVLEALITRLATELGAARR